jgi:hypothetical protein
MSSSRAKGLMFRVASVITRAGRQKPSYAPACLGDTQRQARELISGPSLGSAAKFMTFTRFQSRVVTGLLTGHNTLRRHLHLLGLRDSPLCRKCGVREETSAHILCECEALASLRHALLGSFFSEPENIRRMGLGTIWTYSKATGLP